MGSIDWRTFDQKTSAAGSKPATGGAIDWSTFDQTPSAVPYPASALSAQLPQMGVTPGESLLQGMGDSFVGLGQTEAHAMPGVVSNMYGPFAGSLLKAAQKIVGNTPENLDKLASEREQAYSAQRGPDAGFDWWRLGGNVASPANALLGGMGMSPAASITGKMGQGAILGASASGLAPVSQGDYGSQKTRQAAVGGVFGAISAPIIGAVSNGISSLLARGPVSPEIAAQKAGAAVDAVLEEAGQNGVQIPAEQISIVKQQVADALAAGKELDAKAALRKLDFERAGIPPLTGQITREPNQYAAEQNAATAPGGAPIVSRMNQQAQLLAAKLKKIGGAAEAADPQIAGATSIDSLVNIDKAFGRKVSAAYAEARATAGAAEEVPMAPIAQGYGDVVEQYGRGTIPEGVRNAFEGYGLMSGNQTKTFSYTDAENLLKSINKNYPSGPASAESRALDNLSRVVKSAVSEPSAAGTVDPFASARSLAAQRFKLQEQIPALGAAAADKLDPGTFFNRYVMNSPDYREVQRLGGLLKEQDPATFETMRQQMGQVLVKAGFGTNTAGDKQFSQEAFNSAVKKLGPKLDAFFTPDEVAQIQRYGRVGAFMNSYPAGAPVNTSKTAGALAHMLQWSGGKLLGLIPGGEAIGNVVSGLKDIGSNQAMANKALTAAVPMAAGAEQQRLAQLLYGPLIAGSAAVGVQQARPKPNSQGGAQ